MYDVIIIGSGPSGLTAAIYTTRASLKTLVIAGHTWGGQLMLTTEVENFPGFPEGIQGPELMAKMRKQAERFGAEFVDENFTGSDFTNKVNNLFTIKVGEREYQTKTILMATGADTKWLGVNGEKERIGRGVSSCAPCDAPFFRNKKIIVVGGGDSAMEEAIVLSNFAASVAIVHRREEFRASQIMIDKAKENPKISFLLNSQITEIYGENKVTGVKIKNNKDEITDMPIDGIFVAIGHTPNTGLFKDVELKKGGYVKAQDGIRTNIEGIFVSGDVEDDRYQQAITAAGFGCMAALEIEKFLRNK